MSPRNRVSKVRLFLQLLPIIIVALAGVIGATQLDTVREFLAGASGEEAALQIDATVSYGPLNAPWKNLAQGGEMNNWTITPFQTKVSALQPAYIRLDHIYSFYDVVQLNGEQLTYDFSKLDAVVDSILATGAKPYFSLSYMPIPISADGTITGQPKKWEYWQDVVRATIQHYSVEKGIRDVTYEVWNEPDLFGGWKTYGEKNYLTLYTYADRGRSQVQNAQPYSFGGPAVTAFYKNWFTALAEHAQSNNLRFDFFSWHRYDTDIERFEKDFAEATQLRASYPQLANLQFHLTEYGHNSENDAGYDNAYGAAHTVATSLGMVGKVDRAFVFEIEDGKDPQGQEYWGRWGLLTHRDFGNSLKPRYLAVRLLNRIQGNHLQLTGEGTWVKALATGNGNTIEMVLTNVDSFGSHVENVPIFYKNIEPGTYTLEITQLNGQTRKVTLETSATELATEIFMEANSVVFTRLIPQDESGGPLEQAVAVPETQTPPEPTPESTSPSSNNFGDLL